MLDLIQIFPLQLDSAKVRLISDHCILAFFYPDFKTKRSFGLAFFLIKKFFDI